MNKMTKLALAAMVATGSVAALADETVAPAVVAADSTAVAADTTTTGAVTTDNTAVAATNTNVAAQYPAGFYVPNNLTKVKVDRDDDGDEIELKGDLESADIPALAREAQKALIDAGYTVVKESIEEDDEAKLSYEKVTGEIRETIEIEIDKSWLSDKVEYEVEYEKHD